MSYTAEYVAKSILSRDAPVDQRRMRVSKRREANEYVSGATSAYDRKLTLPISAWSTDYHHCRDWSKRDFSRQRCQKSKPDLMLR